MQCYNNVIVCQFIEIKKGYCKHAEKKQRLRKLCRLYRGNNKMAGRKRLKTLGDVRRYLAGILNRCEAGEIKPEMAGRLAYISNILMKAIEGSDFEARISKFEEFAKTQK